MPLETIVILFGVYAIVTLVAPRTLVDPQLMNKHPRFVLITWLTSLGISGMSLILALIGLVSLALMQHVEETDYARIIVPILEHVFGWLALAVLGILIFRLIAAASELRSSHKELLAQWVMISSSSTQRIIDGHKVHVVDLSEKILMAIPSADTILASTALLESLTPEQRAAALTHEQTHLDEHHGAIRAAGVLAVAVAPGFSATGRMAQATRIATELIADDAAVNRYGSAVVAQALEAAYGASPLVEERVARLRS
jgi:Zn-dependent protease with chaperone function